MDIFRKFLSDESGATSIEYGLIAALIAVSIIAGARSIGTSISDLFGSTESELVIAFDEIDL